jgi:uncharacterized protein YciI
MKTFMFMYLLVDDLDRIKAHLGQHVSYWKNLELDYFRNGPFADKSGGLILFSSDSMKQAENIISSDPLVRGEVLLDYWLKEWVA